MSDASVFTQPVSAGVLPVTIFNFSAITGVPNSIETTIVTHTCLGDETIGDIIAGGTCYARFNIYINTVLQAVIRSGPERQANLRISRPLQFSTGDVIDVKVIHYDLTGPNDFEATILGI